MKQGRKPLRGIPVWALVLAAAALLTPAALAQPADSSSRGPWQIDVFGGWYSGSRPYVFRGSVSDEVQFESAPCYGLRVGRDVNAGLRLELSWTQARPKQSFVTLSPSAIRTIVMNNYEIDADVYIGRGSVRGFAIFGLGGSSTGSSFGGANFTATLGLGVEFFLDRHIAIRADARVSESYGNIGEEGQAAFCDRAGCYYYRRNWYSSATASAGLSYAF